MEVKKTVIDEKAHLEKVRDKRVIIITDKLVFHSTEIALLKKALKAGNKAKEILGIVFNDKTCLISTTVELKVRQQIEKHMNASITLAKELIKITELEGIVAPESIVPLGTIDLNQGYAEIGEENIYTYNLSYATITDGEYRLSQHKPYSVLKNTTVKNLLISP